MSSCAYLHYLSIFQYFIERYLDVSTLAQTKKKELRELLYPLGLRWCTELVHDVAADVMKRFHGRVPRKKADLLSLPGVSDYIASAVCCFTWNQPQPLIDTNTVRVVGRLFGLKIKDSSQRNHYFQELIVALVDLDEPRAYKYALLDLVERGCVKKRLNVADVPYENAVSAANTIGQCASEAIKAIASEGALKQK